MNSKAMEFDKDWVTSVLVSEDTSNPDGVNNVIKIQSEPGVGKYENAASDILRLIVTAQLNSGETVCKSYIYKKEHEGRTQDFLKEMDVFKIEILMYGNYLKQMKMISDKFGGTEDAPWPTCYGYQPSVILLQDLKASGYVTIQKRSGGMDWNHSSLVIKQLAKFHALSASLVQDGTINSSELGPSVFHKNTEVINNLHQQGISTLIDSIKTHWGPEWEDSAVKLQALVEDIGLKIQLLGENTKGTHFDVLNHGDCWTNNFMFKYDEESTSPVEMMFIDFQVSHVNSFAWDLTYFLYNCLLPDFRRENIGKLLDLYTLELNKHCSDLQVSGEVPTREFVQKAMDEIVLFGLVNSLCTVPLLLNVDKPDFEFDMDKLVNTSDQPEKDCNPYQSSCFTDQTCIDIMKREIEYFTSIKLI